MLYFRMKFMKHEQAIIPLRHFHFLAFFLLFKLVTLKILLTQILFFIFFLKCCVLITDVRDHP